MILNVTDCGPDFTSLSQSNPRELDRVRCEAMRVILGRKEDTSTETSATAASYGSKRDKVEQVITYFNAMQNPKNSLHDAVKKETSYILARDKAGWAEQNDQSGICAVSQRSSTKRTEKNAQLSSSPALGHSCQRTYAHTIVNDQLERTMQKYHCSSRPTASHVTSWRPTASHMTS